jgi:Restriction endonuclease fold toxin 7
MPFDPEDTFIPADPAQWPRFGGVPRIVVHPKPPPGSPVSDVPAAAFDDGPDDWFVPPSSAAPNTWPGAQPAASAGGSTPPPGWPDPWAAFWSRIPASSAGAMAWHPPIFLGNPPTLPPANLAPTWPPGLTSPVGTPNIPTAGGIPGGLAQFGSPNSVVPLGGMFDSLAKLGPPGPAVPLGGMFDSLAKLGSPGPAVPLGGMFDSLAELGSPGPAVPLGGMFDSLAELGSPGPDPGSAFPPPPQPQFLNTQAGPLPGRRPISDFSTGEVLGDAAKSFGVGVGRFGIQGAGLLGDVRETIANGAQRAADYFAPGSGPNTGAKVSDFLASYPLLAGPTSSQLQSAVDAYTGPFYQPKTIIGDYAQTAGEYVPGALLNPEGSLAANALRYGLLPALTSETAGQLAQGTTAEPWARALGAVLGAGPGAWRTLVRTRSAPAVAEPLPPPAFDPIAQLRVNAAAGRAAEEAVGIPVNAPKPSINIPGSVVRRFPDRLTEKTLEEVKNVQYLALTQQLRDYLAYA